MAALAVVTLVEAAQVEAAEEGVALVVVASVVVAWAAAQAEVEAPAVRPWAPVEAPWAAGMQVEAQMARAEVAKAVVEQEAAERVVVAVVVE